VLAQIYILFLNFSQFFSIFLNFLSHFIDLNLFIFLRNTKNFHVACFPALLHLSLCMASDMVMPGMAEQIFGLQPPQLVSQLQPSELESLSATPMLGVNGLPFVPMDVAVNQFLQKEQQLELEVTSHPLPFHLPFINLQASTEWS
jgi:hypothetical protein